MKQVIFHKYHGNGNDFIIIDSRKSNIYYELISNKSFDVANLCDRNFGIGADGLIFILDSKSDNDAKMIIFNSDNSEAEMCGNGIRCLIHHLHVEQFITKEINQYKIETKAGIKIAKYNKGEITVRMGKPIFENNLIPTKLEDIKFGMPSGNFTYDNFSYIGYCVGMGNPHLVFFLDDIDIINTMKFGAVFENSIYFPEKTNVHFCQIINFDNIKVNVWERGSGETLACGTGACAVHVAAHSLGLCSSKTIISLPGGDLFIKWNDENDEVEMTGIASKIFTGSFDFY